MRDWVVNRTVVSGFIEYILKNGSYNYLFNYMQFYSYQFYLCLHETISTPYLFCLICLLSLFWGVLFTYGLKAKEEKPAVIEEDEEDEDEMPVMVDLSHADGPVKVVLVSPKAIEEKSKEALKDAMRIIYQVSRRVVDTVEELDVVHRPSQVQVNFGLKLTAEGRAIMTRVKNDRDTNMKIVLTWKGEE